MMMNGWFLAAGALLAAAFFVHVFSGNRFYSAARPDTATAPSGAYEAWLMGRCGVQMISVDLFLCAAFLLLLGTGVLPRNFALELLLLLVFGGCASSGWCRCCVKKPEGVITSGCATGRCSSCCSVWCWAACSGSPTPPLRNRLCRTCPSRPRPAPAGCGCRGRRCGNCGRV